MLTISALFCGLLFGLGLILGGMTNPAKVQAFLDLGGAWDPSLALVMGGAICVASGAFAVAKNRPRSLLGAPMLLPTARDLEPRLILGSVLFGIGWGLAGFCPGPAIVTLGSGAPAAGLFVCAMLLGMLAFEGLEKFLKRAPTSQVPRPHSGAR